MSDAHRRCYRISTTTTNYWSRTGRGRAASSLPPAQQQAVRSAQSYLDMSGFSREGLIKQLSSPYGDQYTVDQATYGARQVSADGATVGRLGPCRADVVMQISRKNAVRGA